MKTKKGVDFHEAYSGGERPGDRRLHKHLPYAYVGPYVITFGDRLKLEEGGAVIFDVPSNEDTAPIFVRLVFALESELFLVAQAIQSITRPSKSQLKRPPVKKVAILGALARVRGTGSLTDADLARKVHRQACRDLREMARANPEIAETWKEGAEPVTMRFVRGVLKNPSYEWGVAPVKTSQPFPKLGMYFRFEGADPTSAVPVAKKRTATKKSGSYVP